MIKGCIQGDRKAQYALYRRYVDSMYHTVLRLTGNRNDCQDVVQEGFVKIFKEIHRFRGDSGLYTWMKRIMINEAINFLRKKKQIPLPVDDLPDQVEVPNMEPQEHRSKELISRIHHAIRKLPQGSRQVLSMFLFEGMSHKEIAHTLAISESTSKTQYRRAKQLVRDYIGARNTMQ